MRDRQREKERMRKVAELLKGREREGERDASKLLKVIDAKLLFDPPNFPVFGTKQKENFSKRLATISLRG